MNRGAPATPPQAAPDLVPSGRERSILPQFRCGGEPTCSGDDLRAPPQTGQPWGLSGFCCLPSPWALLQPVLHPSGVSALSLIITRVLYVQILTVPHERGFLFWALPLHMC